MTLTRVIIFALLDSLILLLCFGLVVSGSPSVYNLVQNCNTDCPINAKFELQFSLSKTYPNPYDPSQIDVHVFFIQGSNNITVNCFPYQGYNRTGNMTSPHWTTFGSLIWVCRFTPTTIAQWNFVITAADTNGSSTTLGTFSSVSSTLPGFVKISSTDPRYFVRSNTNQVFFPIGEDLAWADNSFYYD